MKRNSNYEGCVIALIIAGDVPASQKISTLRPQAQQARQSKIDAAAKAERCSGGGAAACGKVPSPVVDWSMESVPKPPPTAA